MSTDRSWSWVPVGVIAALLLTIAVAWAFHDRAARTQQCARLYAAAATAADSARIDSVVVPGFWTAVETPCAELIDR